MTIGYRIRFYLLAIFLLTGFSAILVRLFVVQIDRFEEFSSKVPGTSEVKVRIPGVRGLIRDRRGRVLVENVARYEMQFNLKEILDNYYNIVAKENESIRKANKKLLTKKEYKEVPVTYFEFYDSSGIKRKRQEKDMVSIVSESVLPYLARLGLYKEFHSGDLQRHWRTHGGLVA
ncbi:MAG: hypothetical protein ACPHOG_10975, partial [Verrucomicrobiales bacterium]